MNILIKNAIVLDKKSIYHKKRVNIHIVNGKIKEIGNTKGDAKSKVIDEKNLHVSPGWFDIGTRLTEPGYEILDTLETLSASANKGGFTGLAVFPNTNPVADNKSIITSIIDKSKNHKTKIYPIGAITIGNKGTDIAEMIDMYKNGAIAFSDGKYPLAHSGVMSRALLYTSNLPTPVINHPEDMTISESGIVNEGKISVYLGVKGRPVLAETMMLLRDIYLCEYNKSTIISHMITSSESVKLIKSAKRKNINVKSTVSFHNLVADETVLKDFDSMHKVLPPLRTKKDINALIKGLKDDTLDAIVSNHYPLNIEDKRKAFFDTKYGAISLEYMFALLNTRLSGKLELDILIEKISNSPREILGLKPVTIEEGNKANMTVFSPDMEWTLTKKDIRSKGDNIPFLEEKLKGKVLHTII
jgi:dihydroorotase